MENITKKFETKINKNTIFLALIILILGVLITFTVIDIFLDGGISWSLRNSLQEFLEIDPAGLDLGLDLFSSGILMVISFFAFLIYAVRSHKLYFLYYSILSFIIALGLLLSAESIVLRNAALSFEISYKLSLTVYLSIAVFILFTAELFPGYLADKVLISVNLITVLFYLMVFIMPAESFRNLHYLNLALLPVFFYLIYILFRASAEGEKNAFAFLFNLIFLTAAVINDLLYAENIFTSISVLRPSLFIFLIIQALILMKFTADNLAEREETIKNLMEENAYLKKKENSKNEFMIENLKELNLPIDAVMSSAESILQNGIFVNKELRKDLADLINNSRGLKYQLKKLNENFQFDSKKTNANINEEELELNSSIDQIISFYNIYLKEKNIKVENNISEDNFYIKVDKVKFIILFFNLLDNILLQVDNGSLVFTAEEKAGEIILNIELKDAKITFKHSGFLSKVQAEEKNGIREDFNYSYKRENRMLNKIDLKQQKINEILELIGAELKTEKVKNNNLLFRINLAGQLNQNYNAADKYVSQPLNQAEKEVNNQKAEEESGAAEIKAAGKTKIIIFSAGESSRLNAVESIVFLNNYQIIETENKAEMFSCLDNQTALVVLNIFSLSDIILDYCREIRNRFSISELPILIIAARNTPDSLIRGFEIGINDFIKKPFEISELKSRMRTLITLKEKVEENLQREQNYLRAQIKPHFLYNTLDTIAYLCEEDSAAAGELILDLANYLRYSFDFDNLDQLVSIHKELELVKFYLSIQQQRFKDKIKVEYDIETNINFSLPPLTLQSLVENAVKHGIAASEGIGFIRITIKEKDDYYLLQVSDNGAGIEQEEIKELLTERQKSSNHQGRKKIGLKNINKRLSKLFDEKVEIENKKSGGTAVSFKIPR